MPSILGHCLLFYMQTTTEIEYTVIHHFLPKAVYKMKSLNLTIFQYLISKEEDSVKIKEI